MQMPGIWRQMNLPAKAALVVGVVVIFIGACILVIGQIATGNWGGSSDTWTEGIMVDGLRSFYLSPNIVNISGEVSGVGTFWNMKFLTSNSTREHCKDHLDSLSIIHVETGSRELLTSTTCEEPAADLGGAYIALIDDLYLYRLGDFTPNRDWGTHSATSDYRTWVYDDTYMSDAGIAAGVAGGIVGSVAICLCCIGCILLCVSWCCCCCASDSGQGVVTGPLPPMVAAEVAPQPPSYQGPEPVVVVMAQVVGQEVKRNEQIA